MKILGELLLTICFFILLFAFIRRINRPSKKEREILDFLNKKHYPDHATALKEYGDKNKVLVQYNYMDAKGKLGIMAYLEVTIGEEKFDFKKRRKWIVV